MTGATKASITIDASEAVKTIEDLLKLETFEAGADQVIDLLLSRSSSLFDYVVFADRPTAVTATDINEIIIKVKIVRTADQLAAAIRASNF